MDKWEYRIFYWVTVRAGHYLQELSASGQFSDFSADNPRLPVVMNQLGSEGWELAGVVESNLIFKRRKL
jgi:hypothetical protein